jgi:hypothetical protein
MARTTIDSCRNAVSHIWRRRAHSFRLSDLVITSYTMISSRLS